MDRKIIVTADNSKTLLISSINETYHSTNGAYQEAIHVFIEAGLHYLNDFSEVRVFEMGFGTGLNAFLSLKYALQNDKRITYHTIEKHPLERTLIDQLDYPALVNHPEISPLFDKLHKAEWEKETEISPYFWLNKMQGSLNSLKIPHSAFDLIFYDAFGPRVQPELWQIDPLKKMFDSLVPGGVLVTYCAQGQFKRNLKSIGFKVENLPGPPGKREMTRAIKPIDPVHKLKN